jgi:hypothetical protein
MTTSRGWLLLREDSPVHSSETVLEFFDADGLLAAVVHLPARTMFWSDGRFDPGESFARHAAFFARLEKHSRQFQTAGPGVDTTLELLEDAWQELDERFEIRIRGSDERPTHLGLHLDGNRASARWL